MVLLKPTLCWGPIFFVGIWLRVPFLIRKISPEKRAPSLSSGVVGHQGLGGEEENLKWRQLFTADGMGKLPTIFQAKNLVRHMGAHRAIVWRCWHGRGWVKSRSHHSFFWLERQKQTLAPVLCGTVKGNTYNRCLNYPRNNFSACQLG